MGGFIGFELNILDAIQNLRSPTLDKLMVTITSLGNLSILWIILTIIFLSTKEYRTMGKIMVLAFIANILIVNLGLKNIFDRTRPYDIIGKTDLLVSKLKDGSFPSGHSSYAFTYFAIIMALSKSRLLKLIIAIIAILIALSRLYLYVHFPSDVIVGSLVGALIGTYSIKLYHMDWYKDLLAKLNLQDE